MPTGKKSEEQRKWGDVSHTQFFYLVPIIIIFLKPLLPSALADLPLSKTLICSTLVPHNNLFLLYFVQATKNVSIKKSSVCPSTTFWYQAHMLAVQSQKVLAEAHKSLWQRTWTTVDQKQLQV